MKNQPLELGGESPYSAYRLLSLGFGAGLLGVAFSTAAKRRFAQPLGLMDFGLTAAATHKLAQIVTKERVTMYLRSPFTWQKDEGKHGAREEVPKEHGFKRAVGELLTCPYCIAPWISTALIAGHVFAPAQTRIVTTIFAATAAADLLTQLKANMRELVEVQKEEVSKMPDLSPEPTPTISVAS